MSRAKFYISSNAGWLFQKFLSTKSCNPDPQIPNFCIYKGEVLPPPIDTYWTGTDHHPPPEENRSNRAAHAC